MRLLALVTDAFGASGGIAQYNRDLFNALAESQAIERVDILPRYGKPSSKLPERLYQHNAQGGKLAYIAKALRLAKSNQPDSIFCGHIRAPRITPESQGAEGLLPWLRADSAQSLR